MNLESYAHPASLPSSVSFRVARLLDLEVEDPEDMGDLQLAKRIAGGLQPSSVFALGDVIGKSRVIGAMVPEATLRRARKAGKPLSRELSERLYEVGRVVDAVSVVYHGDRGSIDVIEGADHGFAVPGGPAYHPEGAARSYATAHTIFSEHLGSGA